MSPNSHFLLIYVASEASFAFPARAGPLTVTEATQMRSFSDATALLQLSAFSPLCRLTIFVQLPISFISTTNSVRKHHRTILRTSGSLSRHTHSPKSPCRLHDDGHSLPRTSRRRFTCEVRVLSDFARRTQTFIPPCIRHIRNIPLDNESANAACNDDVIPGIT